MEKRRNQIEERKKMNEIIERRREKIELRTKTKQNKIN